MPVPDRQPRLAADCIIQIDGDPARIVLVRRRNPPHGWAIPGGFVDYGESVEAAAVREMKEETGLDVTLTRQLHIYSDPARDPRGHTVTVVFVGTARGAPAGGDDALEARVFTRSTLPADLVFDHPQVLEDYFTARY
ncbi:MAG: NUDIX hydrolase [Acidobacteria bacterium]|nr:NUDIX hydrolase [Acidobacteriota bacterium]